MASSGRPLAAAPTTQSNFQSTEGNIPSRDPNRDPNLGGRPKRTLIESACSACRKRKSKCDGARPICSRCQALGTECVYEAEEGESRWSALKRRAKDMKAERDQLSEILAFLQSQPEADALEVFHRIRSSRETDGLLSSVLQEIRERLTAVSSGSTPSAAQGQTRLPPIRSMLEGQEAAMNRSGSAQHRRASLTSDGSGSYDSSHSGFGPTS